MKGGAAAEPDHSWGIYFYTNRYLVLATMYWMYHLKFS